MFSPYLNLILDIVMLVGLGVMVFYCIKLSKALNNFRKYRQEFNALLQELSRNIEVAQDATSKLKDSSFEAGEDLQKVVNNARKLADELQLMNDMGNALANRLERLSDSGRDKVNRKPDVGEYAPASSPRPAAKVSPRAEPKEAPSFFIKDREFESGSSFGNADEEDFQSEEMDEFESRAERELFEALQNNAKGKAL